MHIITFLLELSGHKSSWTVEHVFEGSFTFYA